MEDTTTGAIVVVGAGSGDDDCTMCIVTDRCESATPTPYRSEYAIAVTVTLAPSTRSGQALKVNP